VAACGQPVWVLTLWVIFCTCIRNRYWTLASVTVVGGSNRTVAAWPTRSGVPGRVSPLLAPVGAGATVVPAFGLGDFKEPPHPARATGTAITSTARAVAALKRIAALSA